MSVAASAHAEPGWENCGWSGGGLYWSAAYHPARRGTLFMGSDVTGVYKSEDNARTWKFANNGLLHLGIYGLAVDRKSPDTVYAASEIGLHKSTDAGGHWTFIENTGPKELRITGERYVSVRPIAVDTTDSNIVYAGNAGGIIYKSADGARTWKVVYTTPALPNNDPAQPDATVRTQFGDVNGSIFGGVWFPLAVPAGTDANVCQGLGFPFLGNGSPPKAATIALRTRDGAVYNSRNLADLFERREAQEVWLSADDFTLDAAIAKAEPEKAAAWPAKPRFETGVRVDFSCVNMTTGKPSVAFLGAFYVSKSKDAPAPDRAIVQDLPKNPAPGVYGNAMVGEAKPKLLPVHSVAVSAKEPSVVLAATEAGVIMSENAGERWRLLDLPGKAYGVAVADTDPNIMFACFDKEGIWKSADRGRTWAKSSPGDSADKTMREVVISPVNPQDVFAIAIVRSWGGVFYASNDGGKTWTSSNMMTVDREANPTTPNQATVLTTAGISRATNLTINPFNPSELFISANWRPCLTEDGGKTWTERDRGADITCFFGGIRFSGSRVYAAAADEGYFVSEDNGRHWRQIWPVKWDFDGMTGHYWGHMITNRNGKDRIIAAMGPAHESRPSLVVVSEDGGATFKVTSTASGLPDYRPTANTFWGFSSPRGLAVDPKNPDIVYLGMDGDAGEGRMGGGIFKSEDGGYTWKQLPNQPGSRRGYYGLCIDPTDSRRIYWAACGNRGGVYRSEDGGGSWELVYQGGQWFFNLMVAADGTVYAADKSILMRSADHGKTWTQASQFKEKTTILAIEVHPDDPKTLWISRIVWGGPAIPGQVGVFKTTDGGETWTDITGDLPSRMPLCLRFNPQTRELWAAGSGVFKLPQ